MAVVGQITSGHFGAEDSDIIQQREMISALKFAEKFCADGSRCESLVAQQNCVGGIECEIDDLLIAQLLKCPHRRGSVAGIGHTRQPRELDARDRKLCDEVLHPADRALDGDLGVKNPAANIETVQKLTTPERMSAIAARRGAADVLIVRHIMEHAEDLHAFIHGIANYQAMRGQAYNVGLSDANLSKMELCGRIKAHVPAFVFLDAPAGEVETTLPTGTPAIRTLALG